MAAKFGILAVAEKNPKVYDSLDWSLADFCQGEARVFVPRKGLAGPIFQGN